MPGGTPRLSSPTKKGRYTSDAELCTGNKFCAELFHYKLLLITLPKARPLHTNRTLLHLNEFSEKSDCRFGKSITKKGGYTADTEGSADNAQKCRRCCINGEKWRYLSNICSHCTKKGSKIAESFFQKPPFCT